MALWTLWSTKPINHAIALQVFYSLATSNHYYFVLSFSFFNSASFSISRIITGQLDAYVDIGNRIFRDHPNTEKDFRASGRGYILHLFPYDIAAAVYLAQKSGVIISDGYGNSLGTTELLNMDPMNQQSCIAACNSTLHQKLLSSINW